MIEDSRIGVPVEIVLLKLVSDLAIQMTLPHGELEMSPCLLSGEASIGHQNEGRP